MPPPTLFSLLLQTPLSGLSLSLICISRPSARRRRVLSLALLLLLLRLLPVDRRAEQKRDAT